MQDSVERISRKTGRAIDVDILKRRSWSGFRFTAEFVRISDSTLYKQTLRTTPVDATHWSIRSMGRNWLFPHHDPPDVDGVWFAAAP